MEQINIILLIVAAAAVITAVCSLLLPWLKRRGVDVQGALTGTAGILDAADTITDILKAAFPTSAVANIADKVIDYAQIGVQKAEQLYHIGSIPEHERKTEAAAFVYEALQAAGIETTPAIENIVDGAIEAAVLTLGHTTAAGAVEGETKKAPSSEGAVSVAD